MEVKILENQSVVSNYYATEFSRVIRYVGAVKKKKKKLTEVTAGQVEDVTVPTRSTKERHPPIIRFR